MLKTLSRTAGQVVGAQDIGRGFGVVWCKKSIKMQKTKDKGHVIAGHPTPPLNMCVFNKKIMNFNYAGGARV